MNLQISREELELIQEALHIMHRDYPGSRSTENSQELALRIHSFKSDYDTEKKAVIDPFHERFPECKAPDWTIKIGFEHDSDCGWCM